MALVDQVLAAMDSGKLTDRLHCKRTPAAILDMGCGAGVAANCMAGAFPDCTVHAVDPDAVALVVARRDAELQGNTNIQFFEALGEDFDHGIKYDMAVCLDIIHDAPRPDLILNQIRTLLKPGGTLLV